LRTVSVQGTLPAVAPNDGTVVGDLRVLLTRLNEPVWQASIASVVRDVVLGPGWEVSVVPVDSPEVLACRVVGRRRTARRLRDEFVRKATAQALDRTDTAKITRALGG
jgi:hypothetical protein